MYLHKLLSAIPAAIVVVVQKSTVVIISLLFNVSFFKLCLTIVTVLLKGRGGGRNKKPMVTDVASSRVCRDRDT